MLFAFFMTYNSTAIETTKTPNDLKFEKLLNERKIARDFQERRHLDWGENYELYRNKVKTNRLTQRQAVNIPLMKETVKTLLSTIDDPPSVDWKNLDSDEMKEIVYQEVWNDSFKRKKLEWVDLVDKKNVLLYGLSTKKLNIGDEGIDINVLDVFDVVYDPIMNPIDIESARFIIHQNIFRSLREILADDRYTQKGKDALKAWTASQEAIVQSSENKEELERKQERLKAMGVDSDEFDRFSGGDVIVNLCEHYTKVWNAKTKKFEKRVVVYAQDEIELLDETLLDLIGVDFWPFVVWSEDPENNDIYADGVADLVRTPNKILNIWFSQLTENRTLRNFQMHWYDSTTQGYEPQTYEPGPGRMLPAPGDPNKTIMPVAIEGLDETLTAIDFLTKIVERGSGATAIEKGTGEKQKTTLGEVEILVGKATERVIGMQKFYRGAWYELALKWDKLMQENSSKMMKLFKTNSQGKIYPKKVYPIDWKGDYEPIISSTSEQETEQTKGIQKWQFILNMFPNNPALRQLAQKRSLEIVDLTPQELQEVQEAEEQAQKMAEQQAQAQLQQQQMAGQQQQQPQQPQQQQQPTASPPEQGGEEVASLLEELSI